MASSSRMQRAIVVITLSWFVWSLILCVLIPKHEDPKLTWRLAYITTRFPGASAETIESDVSSVLEKHLQKIDELKHVTSVSRRGVSMLQVELQDQVTDPDPVWQQVRHVLSEASSDLPAAALPPSLDDKVMGSATWVIEISSFEKSLIELEEYAEQLEESIRYLPFVAETTLLGTQKEIAYVNVDPARMAAYHLSFDSVAAELTKRNPTPRSGTVESDSQRISVDSTDDFQHLDEIENAFLTRETSQNTTVRVADIADVTRESVEPEDPLVRVNGRPCISLVVRAQRELGNQTNAKTIQSIVTHFSQTLPDVTRCRIIHDEARYAQRRLSRLGSTLVCSMILVFVSSALFMGWRSGVTVAITIPITGILSIAILYCLGFSLEQMSFMGIIMSFGMLVDDAIVITEQIQQHQRRGMAGPSAVKQALRELFVPMLTTTLTTIAAFLPIWLLPGGTGEFVRSIPVSVAVCLLCALAVSATIVPWIALLLSKSQSQITGHLDWFDRLLPRFRTLLESIFRKPLLVIAIVALIFSLLATCRFGIRRDFFSPVERDQFLISVFTDPGSSLRHTSSVVADIESLLAKDDGIADSFSVIGRNVPQFFYNLFSQETFADDFAQIVAFTNDAGKTPSIAERLQTTLNQIPDALCTVSILEHGAPLSAPFEIRTRGRSHEVLNEVASRVTRILKETPGIRSVRTNSGFRIPRFRFDINEPVANRVGVTHDQVASHLRYSTDGIEAGHLRQNEERIPVRIRYPKSRHSATEMNELTVKSQDQLQWVPLTSIGQHKLDWEMSRVYRRDGMRTETVTAYPNFQLSAAQVATRFKDQLDELASQLPAGYSLEIGGENEQREMAEFELARNAIYSILIILCLLMLEFKSLRLVFLILALVPLSFCGSMFGLWLTGWPLNFMALMGMLMLAGILVNDAVILIDGYERALQRPTDQTQQELVINVTLDRTRHVVITTVTTVVGLIPLALSRSLLWPPLGIAIIFGLLAATILTLILVPLVYFKICESHS